MGNEIKKLEKLIPENKKINNIREKFDKNQKGPKSMEELIEFLAKETNFKIFEDILNVLHKYACVNMFSALADDGGTVELEINKNNEIQKVDAIVLPYLRRASSLFFPWLYEGAKALYYDLRIGKEYISNENEYVLPYFIVLYAFKKSEHLFDDIVVRAIKSNFISRCALSLKGESTDVYAALISLLDDINPVEYYSEESERQESIKNIVGIVKAIALYNECEKNDDFQDIINGFYNVNKKMGNELDFNSDVCDLHHNALYTLRSFLAENADSLRNIDEEEDYIPVTLEIEDKPNSEQNKDKKEKEKEIIDYKRNIRSAILFLNIFNLKLEKKEDVNKDTTLKIKNRSNEEVGKLYFNKDTVKIETNTNFGMMKAEYDLSKINKMDSPKNARLHRCFDFITWNTEINYEIIKDKNNKFIGNLLLNCRLDEKLGANVLAHSKLDYYQNDQSVIELYFQEDGYPFSAVINTNGVNESIKIDLFSSFLSYIEHEIRKTGGQDGFIYRNFNAIFQKNEIEKDKLCTLNYIEELGSKKKWERKEYSKITKEDDKKEAVIQKGNLMKQIDPYMYEKINELRVFFRMGDLDLINNLANVSLGSYEDDEIKAILGFDRVPMFYQDGVKTKEECYFGLEKDNVFLTKEEYKRLIYKNDKNRK